jgi:hypothetical protein
MVHINFEEVSRKGAKTPGIFELSLNSKCRVGARRLQNYLFNLIDYRPLRSSRKIVFESFNAACRSLSECFNTSISTVAHITDNLMSRRCSLRKETIPDPLNFTFDKKLSRYAHST